MSEEGEASEAASEAVFEASRLGRGLRVDVFLVLVLVSFGAHLPPVRARVPRVLSFPLLHLTFDLREPSRGRFVAPVEQMIHLVGDDEELNSRASRMSRSRSRSGRVPPSDSSAWGPGKASSVEARRSDREDAPRKRSHQVTPVPVPAPAPDPDGGGVLDRRTSARKYVGSSTTTTSPGRVSAREVQSVTDAVGDRGLSSRAAYLSGRSSCEGVGLREERRGN